MAFIPAHALQLLQRAHGNGRLPHALLVISEDSQLGHELVMGFLPSLLAHVPRDLQGEDGQYLRILRPLSRSRMIRAGDMRGLDDFIYQSAPPGQWKVVVICEAERLNESAANVFLKTLEEPPPNTLIILLCSGQEQLLPTIRSRCVKIVLQGAASKIKLSSRQLEFVADWLQASDAIGCPGAAMLLRGKLEIFLKNKRQQIQKRLDEQLKKQAEHITQRTGNSSWLSQQEDAHKAAVEIEYAQLRGEILDLMVLWFGDALRLQHGAGNCLLADYEAPLRRLAEAATARSLLARIEAIEQLRMDLLTTNINEAIALDVHLLQALA